MALRRSTPPLYERDGLLRLVKDACERAVYGSGGSLFVLGDAGLGKSAMLDHVEAGAAGVLVGRGSGAPAESGLAYSVVLSALSQLSGRDLLDASAGLSGPIGARGSRFYGTLREVESIGKPALVLLDDLHWADVDSLELTAFLCRRIAALPVVILGTLRRWPTTAYTTVSDLVASGYSTLHSLQPLSQAACDQLLGDLTGVPAEPSVSRQVWHACAGNPLLVHQAVRSLEADAGLPGLGATDAGAQLLLSRFAGSSTTTVSYARAASVFGNRFRPELVQQITELSADEADRALFALCAAGLVVGDGSTSARFVHPLFRQILYQDLPAPVRARLHGSVMRVLLKSGSSPAEAAEHAMLGGGVGDEAAIGVLTAAGRSSLEGGGVETAVAQLTAATDLAGTGASPELLLLLGEALSLAGQPDASIAVADRLFVVANAQLDHQVQALRVAGHAAFVAGRPEEAVARFDRARAMAKSLDRATLLDTLLDAAFTFGTTAPVPTLLGYAIEARAVASESDGARHALAEVAWGSVAAMGGDPAGVEAVVRASEAAHRYPGHLAISWRWRVDLARMNVARQVGRYDEACAIYLSTAPELDQAADPLPIVTMAIVHSDTLKRLGRLVEARVLLERAAGLVELLPVGSSWLEMARTDVDQELGEPVAARCAGIESRLGPQRDSHPLLWLWLWAVHSDALVDEGQPERAAGLVAQCRPLAERSGIADPLVVPWARSAVEAAIAVGNLDQAEAEIAWLEEAPSAGGHAGHQALLGYARGLWAWKRKSGEGEERFEEALGWLDVTTLPLFRARVLLAYGRLLRQSGRPARARSLLSEAAHLAEASSAAGLARAAQGELRAAGGRRRQRGDAPERLTVQERRIVELAVEGRTNSEIGTALYVSRKTVESHLGHIYAKLGIASRHDLARYAATHADDDQASGESSSQPGC